MKTQILIYLLSLLPILASAQSQAEMNEEAINAHKKADIAMTRVYKLVMEKMTTPEDKKSLLEAQRAWIRYKETHCQSYTNQFKGGSITPLIYYSCLEDLTNIREKQLQAYIDNF
jgi:uncharacterized protein YecT (DUF1311 family)